MADGEIFKEQNRKENKMTTRRDAIKGIAAAVGLSAVPLSSIAMEENKTDSSMKLSEYISTAIKFWDPPPLLWKPKNDDVSVELPNNIIRDYCMVDWNILKSELTKMYPNITISPTPSEMVKITYFHGDTKKKIAIATFEKEYYNKWR